jgi:hypothetical protein
MNNYHGDIIEESLENKDILKKLKITATRVKKVVDEHQTPWLSQWTLDTIEVRDNEADNLAVELSKALEVRHGWYIDYRNDIYHYVIFKDKVFKLDRHKETDYEEMIKYGLSNGTPRHQLPSFSDLPLDVLDSFLREANLHTYADKDVKRVTSLRPNSKDYHFEKDGLAYHDTYFGSTNFIGEEVVYQDSQPVWGMNYYGFTLNNEITESLFDAILRPALMSGSGGNIPVRGPKEFLNGEWKYTFNTDGDLANFTGLEEISKNGEIVCRLYCHGGFIK